VDVDERDSKEHKKFSDFPTYSMTVSIPIIY